MRRGPSQRGHNRLPGAPLVPHSTTPPPGLVRGIRTRDMASAAVAPSGGHTQRMSRSCRLRGTTCALCPAELPDGFRSRLRDFNWCLRCGAQFCNACWPTASCVESFEAGASCIFCPVPRALEARRHLHAGAEGLGAKEEPPDTGTDTGMDMDTEARGASKDMDIHACKEAK